MSALCKPHRFGDPVSQANCDIHDTARLMVTALETLDRMGIEIVSVAAARNGTRRMLVVYSRACDALEGAICVSGPAWHEWAANRYGIEIRWLRAAGEAA